MVCSRPVAGHLARQAPHCDGRRQRWGRILTEVDTTDRIYREPRAEIDDFVFDREVARVFPDMIRRSVPGYGTVIDMTAVLAARYVQAGSRCYDLGCSLGASLLAMHRGLQAERCRLIGVDNSAEMLQQARSYLPLDDRHTSIELRCADVTEVEIGNASMVVLNFTLQFIPPQQRLALLSRIRAGLLPGGILLLSEKISFDDPRQEKLQIELHHAFKRANGYGELEISQKRNALERVLLPETLECHKARLAQAGFRRCELWFQCFNFVSLVAWP